MKKFIFYLVQGALVVLVVSLISCTQKTPKVLEWPGASFFTKEERKEAAQILASGATKKIETPTGHYIDVPIERYELFKEGSPFSWKDEQKNSCIWMFQLLKPVDLKEEEKNLDKWYAGKHSFKKKKSKIVEMHFEKMPFHVVQACKIMYSWNGHRKNLTIIRVLPEELFIIVYNKGIEGSQGTIVAMILQTFESMPKSISKNSF